MVAEETQTAAARGQELESEVARLTLLAAQLEEDLTATAVASGKTTGTSASAEAPARDVLSTTGDCFA